MASAQDKPPAEPDFVEQRRIADDMAAQELGPSNDVPRLPLAAPSYIRAVHPEQGDEVTFVPGEALPDWVRDVLPAGKPDPKDPRVILVKAAKAAK
jgi:hypothetical protein